MLNKYLISPDLTVKQVITYMEENGLKAVVIVNDDRKLLGLFTLGDMRHFFLNNGDLSANISEAMNRDPIIFKSEFDIEKYNNTSINVLSKSNTSPNLRF